MSSFEKIVGKIIFQQKILECGLFYQKFVVNLRRECPHKPLKTLIFFMETRSLSFDEESDVKLTDDYFESFPRLSQLNLSCCNLTELPRSIYKLKNLVSLNISWNSLEAIPVELGHLHCLRKLNIEGNPGAMIQPYIHLVEQGDRAVIDFLRNVVRPRPKPAPLHFHPYKSRVGDSLFSLMSYNIFAPNTMRPGLYPFSQEKYLKYEYRLPLLRQQIKHVNPDIFCCQEVQGLTFLEFEKDFPGYEGHFVPKGRISEKRDDQKPFVSGQATFFNTSLFESIGYISFEFRQTDEARQSSLFEKIDLVDDVCLMSLLKSRTTQPVGLLVINIHLTWPPSLADVRAVFVDIALKKGEEFAKQYTDNFELIICGDWNSAPDTSPVITAKESHLNLKSVYDELGVNNGPTIFMNSTINTVDHVYHTNKRLESLSSLVVLNKRQLARYTFFVPCEWHPSDHFPVGAIFRIKSINVL